MKVKYKSVFISDTHLGMKHINNKCLLNFLRNIECENLFLVGDIVDGWNYKKKKWNKTNDKIVKNVMNKWKAGTKIYYIPGNHDDFVRNYIGEYTDNFIICNDYIYESNGKKYLLLHGDLFDVVMVKAKWLAKIGDVLYDAAFFVNRQYNLIRWLFNKPYFSLAQFAKDKVKNVLSFILQYESLLIEEARRYDCDGVICGHIHHAIIKDVDGVTYMNCGDWVESCTAIVENYNGEFKILHWNELHKL